MGAAILDSHLSSTMPQLKRFDNCFLAFDLGFNSSPFVVISENGIATGNPGSA
jgi:hypothetical protein